jgi:hypothetical protein
MLITFFNIKGITHKEFVLVGQTVNFVRYCDVLLRLRENVRRLRSELWRQKNWLLHHDNAQSHTSLFNRQFFGEKKNNMTVVPHPRNLSTFPRLKIKLKGSHFYTIEVNEAESQAALNTLTEHDFQDALKNGRSAGNGAYAQNGTTSRMMVASRPKVSF